MFCNQSSEKVEWGHLKMPEIVIDSDNESTTKIYDNEQYNNRFLDTNREESNHLSFKSNLDDVDSGIHESNDIFLQGIFPTLHSNRLSLRDMKKRSNLSEIRSYSTNCLPADCSRYKDGPGILDPRLCRNCSTKNSKKQFEPNKRDLCENQYSLKEMAKTPEVKQKSNGQEGLQQRLCRIRVLLVCMKILLGSTMTGLGLYLFSLSVSIKVKDCAFWASGPLLVSGLCEVFIFNWKNKLKKKTRMCCFLTIICGLLSFICSILCLLSSIYSGVHGNWISKHSENCFPEDREKEVLEACCFQNLISKNDSCQCRETRLNSFSPIITTMSYENIKCRDLFSAVKDYLILQCALMGIGSGVCLWLLQMTIHRLIHAYSINRQKLFSRNPAEDQNCIGQSPVIPLKIRCIQTNEKPQIFNELVHEKLVHNHITNEQLIKHPSETQMFQ